MAADIRQRIISIEAKARVLVERNRRLAARLAEAENEAERLKAVIADNKSRMARLESEVAFLKNSASLAPAVADVDETRLMISGLVREIDKCIRDLSD